MSHFARIEAGVVQEVIVAEEDFVAQLPGTWLQCSYNTRGGVHTAGGTPLRLNYPGPGWLYDAERDAFIQPEPQKPLQDPDGNPLQGAWTLNNTTGLWEFGPA